MDKSEYFRESGFKIWLRQECTKQKSITQLAKELEIDVPLMKYYLKKYNIPAPCAKKYQSKEWLKQEMHEKSVKQISKEQGVHIYTIHRY